MNRSAKSDTTGAGQGGKTIPNDNDFPHIVTEHVSSHLAGQYTIGPLRYVIFSDDQGPVGLLWRATATGDEAVGWEPNRSHPAANKHKETWRIRITNAQERPFAKDYDPGAEEAYSAEQFFHKWTEVEPHEMLSLDGPYDFAGGTTELVSHFGWT